MQRLQSAFVIVNYTMWAPSPRAQDALGKLQACLPLLYCANPSNGKLPWDYPTCRLHARLTATGFIRTGNFNSQRIYEILQSRSRWGIAKAIATHSAKNLEEQLAANKALGTPVFTPQQWAAHPHGKSLLATTPVTVEPLAAGTALSQKSQEPNTAKPLQGLRVLDLTRVLAGPSATRLLAHFGADVTKISCDALPYYYFFDQIENVGKKRLKLDLKSTQGRADFLKLVANADVIVDSYRPGALANLGFDPDTLAKQAANGLVYTSISCYGPGPWYDRGGYDSLAQDPRLGWHLCTVDTLAMMASNLTLSPHPHPNDYITGMLAVAGILRALQLRDQDGGSYKVETFACTSGDVDYALWFT